MDLYIAKILVQDALNKADPPAEDQTSVSVSRSVFSVLRNAVFLAEAANKLTEERKALEFERRQIETLHRLVENLVSENRALKQKLAAHATS
jgi:hypothetical protein